MESRQLWDPRRENFVAKAALIDLTIQRCRISDFALVAFLVLIKAKYLTKTQVDWFETAYVQFANPRSERKHEGLPALAPDKSIMKYKASPSQGGDESGYRAWDGDTGQKYGKWTIETVSKCEGYDDWLQGLKQGISDIADEASLNHPYPDVNKCIEANGLADERLLDKKLKGSYGKLKRKLENDAKLIEAARQKAERKKDVKLAEFATKSAERNAAEIEAAKEREAERIEAARKATESKQQASKTNTSKQKSPASIAVRRPPPERQQQMADKDSDEQDHDDEPASKRRKKNHSKKTSKLLIDKYENDHPEDSEDDRSGKKLRTHADKMEEEFEGALKRYATYLDGKFSNQGETRHRKRNFWTRIGKVLDVSDDEAGSGDESSNVDESIGSEEEVDEDEESD